MTKLKKILFAQKDILSLAALIGLWCVFLWNAFGADRSFALFQDNEIGIGPVASAMSAVLGHGEWPLRLGTILGGVSLYNYTQLSSFYPGYLLALPIYGNPFDVMYSMHWVILWHLLIQIVNMFLFIRVIGVSRLAALTGATLFTFSANNFIYAGWMNIVAPYSWLPLYLAGLVGIFKDPRSISYSAMALGGIVLLTLASPSQPLIHAVFLSIVFVCAYWLDKILSGETKMVPFTIGRVLAVGVLALFLVAPALLPAALGFKDMIRWIGPFPPVLGNARIPFEAFLIDQLSIADLGGVLFQFKVHAVGNQFTGVLVIALASVAVVSRPRSWIVFALAFIAIYSLISSTGSNLGLAYLNYLVPLLDKIREPSRFLVLFQLAIGALAALGIDELRKTASRIEGHANAKRQMMALVVTVIIAVFTLSLQRERIVSIVPPFVSISVLITLSFITWVAIKWDFRRLGTMITAVWCGAVVTFLAIEVPWIPPPVSSSRYLTSGILALDKAIERVSILDSKHEYRVIFDGKINRQEAAMYASYRGVRTFNSYLSPAPRRQFEELYYHGPRADNYFRILGAKYLICIECTSESIRGYKHLESISGYEIYETEDVLPRSYIVQQLNGEFRDLSDFVTKAASLDLAKKLLFLEPNKIVALNGSNNVAVDDCISREETRTTNRSRFVVQCKSPGVLVLNEFFDDAWNTSVDGVKMQSLRVNGNQIAVPFAAGSHVIEFRYLPTIFVISICLMFVGLLYLIYLIYRIVTRKSIKVNDDQ